MCSCVLSCGESCCLLPAETCVSPSVKGKGSWSVSPVCVFVWLCSQNGGRSVPTAKRGPHWKKDCAFVVCCVCVCAKVLCDETGSSVREENCFKTYPPYTRRNSASVTVAAIAKQKAQFLRFGSGASVQCKCPGASRGVFLLLARFPGIVIKECHPRGAQ